MSALFSMSNFLGPNMVWVSAFLNRQPWGPILLVIAVTITLERVLRFILSRTEKKQSPSAGEPIRRTMFMQSAGPLCNFILLAGAYLVVTLLQAPSTDAANVNVKQVLRVGLKIAFALNLLWLLWQMSEWIGMLVYRRIAHRAARFDKNVITVLQQTFRAFAILFVGLYIIQALGYSITGLIAGLGIGGLAVAMAAKDTLSNVFGSIMILADHPFSVGDWVKVGDDEGTVEHIGLRSTRIRTFAKSLITVPNSTIASAAVNNFSRMPKRRVEFTVGLTYETTRTQLCGCVERIRGLLKSHPAVDQDLILVFFTGFGSHSLDIMVYYFTRTTEWAAHLDLRQEINIGIMKIVEEMHLSFAFPTQTVHMIHNDSADMPFAKMSAELTQRNLI